MGSTCKIMVCVAALLLAGTYHAMAQYATDSVGSRRILSEGRLSYTVQLEGNKDTTLQNLFDKATYDIWMRGNMIRMDFISPLRNQYILYSAVAQSGTVIKETGTEKYITELDKSQWPKYFSTRQASDYRPAGDTLLQGHNCKKVVATLANGKEVVIYYTKDIVPFVKGFDLLLAPLEGVAVQYSYPYQSYTLTYKLAGVEAIPVSSARFELPQGNYKKLQYVPSD